MSLRSSEDDILWGWRRMTFFCLVALLCGEVGGEELGGVQAGSQRFNDG